jgi:glutamate---cysteine ligase / carboxylate-amine ligase
LEARSGGIVRPVSARSVGVEEEFLLVEPGTGQPRAVAETVLAAARQAGADGHDEDGAALEFELKQQQLETNSEPCRTLGELDREIRRGRAAFDQMAGELKAWQR